MKTLSYWSALKRQVVLPCVTILTVMFSLTVVIADASDPEESLLTQYVQSKGSGIIVFESSNIKQFWIDSSVVSKDNSINILLSSKNANGNESVPLKIQLANVNEAMDCAIEVISETEDSFFSVLDNNLAKLSSSENKEKFLDYFIKSSVFHMEDTKNLSFILRFGSKTADHISIKRIILSFSKNKESSFLVPPGKLKIMDKNISASASSTITNVDSDSFAMTGKRTAFFSSNKILVTNNILSSSVTIKNTGENSTLVYLGYRAYTQNHILLSGSNYPYKNINKVLSVVSSVVDSNKIVVDSYTDWSKGCYLALNAKEDMSDIPNTDFIGTILDIKKLENGQAEISLDKPFKSEIKDGTKVRVHGLSGAYLYSDIKALQPGEEQVFSATIMKDDSILEYSSNGFSRGVYYVIPLILSYSVDSQKENTILIRDFVLSY